MGEKIRKTIIKGLVLSLLVLTILGCDLFKSLTDSSTAGNKPTPGNSR